jgi:hypothetical protein
MNTRAKRATLRHGDATRPECVLGESPALAWISPSTGLSLDDSLSASAGNRASNYYQRFQVHLE